MLIEKPIIVNGKIYGYIIIEDDGGSRVEIRLGDSAATGSAPILVEKIPSYTGRVKLEVMISAWIKNYQNQND